MSDNSSYSSEVGEAISEFASILAISITDPSQGRIEDLPLMH